MPGVVLRQSQYVCEKHFENKFIHKQWIKRSVNGQIIAQVSLLSQIISVLSKEFKLIYTLSHCA